MSVEGKLLPTFDQFTLLGQLSKDHDATNPLEVERVQNVGGVFKPVKYPNRIVQKLAFYAKSKDKHIANLEPTRSFGNFELKQGNDPNNYHMSTIPEIYSATVEYSKIKKNTFVFIGSDGIFANASNKELYNFFEMTIKNRKKERIFKIGENVWKSLIHIV